MAEKTIESISAAARSYYQKALAASERNNWDYAVELFLECLKLEPNFTKARNYLRAAQIKKAESAGGLRRVFAAAKSQPLLTKAKMVLGKNPTEAMVMAEQVLSEDPKNSQALLLLAEAAEAAQFPETTVQTLEYYSRLNPRDTRALHWLARSYMAVKSFDQAREIYQRLLQLNPNDFEAQKGLKNAAAQGAMQAGRWEEAQSYRDVIKDKEEAVALEQQSRVVRAEDMTARLIREHLEKLQADPGNPVIQRELGRLYAQQGDYASALQYLEKLLAAEAGADPSLLREIAEIKIKRLESDIAAKKKQLAEQPDNTSLQAEIAELEKQLQEQQLAEAIRLVEKYPNDLLYRYDLAVLYMKAGRIQEAIEEFQRAVGHPQRRVASLNYLGQCFHQLGLYDLAADQFQKALDELPMMDNLKKEITYNLATTYEAMGEHDKAIAEYKKIAAVDFGYRDVRTKITAKPAPKPAS